MVMHRQETNEQLSCALDQLAQTIEIGGEGLAALFGQSRFGVRFASEIALFDGDVTGVLELPQMHRKVSLCGAQHCLELIEIRHTGVGQVRHDPEAQAPVDYIVDAVDVELGHWLVPSAGLLGLVGLLDDAIARQREEQEEAQSDHKG